MDKKESKALLYLNMIIGDFESVEIVKRSIDSVISYVDGAYITLTYKDTKPDKNHPLVVLLSSYQNLTLSYFKWTKNFAEARQYALEQVPQGDDHFIYWQDADDVLANGENLHQLADEMITYHQSAIYLDYWYQVDLDEKGNVREIVIEHKRERIVQNNNTWRWIGDLHETLIEQQQENVIKHFRPECHVIHLTTNDRLDKNIDRNIEILEESVKKTQRKDPRPIIYLAKAYFDKCKMTEMPQQKIYMDLALTLFHEYLEGSGQVGTKEYREASGWAEERSTAWDYIGQIAVLSGHPEVAVGAYQNAIDEAPHFPNYYIDMAMCYVMQDDYKRARHWLNVATSMPEPDTTIIQFPREMKARALEVSYHCNIHDQKLDWAVQDAEKLLELIPGDERAKERVTVTKQLQEYNKAAQSIVFLGKYLEAVGEKTKLQYLVQSIPDAMGNERFAAEMKHLFLPPKRWAPNEIAILCGPGFEKWDPTSVEKGLGGSEEAVVYLSQELTKLGWQVTVYANPEKPGDFGGVTYKTWHDINPRDDFNVLVLWRSIGFIDVKPKARLTVVWMHDVPNNPDFTEERVGKVDKVAVLSEFHKSLLRLHKKGLFEKFPENKVFVTSNGIPKMDITEWKGNSKRVIYASSPDRGLVYLLRMWPDIKTAVPEAELHIYYGWTVYDALFSDNPARQKWKKQVLDMMKQDGVIDHGRVGHTELHKAYNESGIWAYPTDFEEISCISAMKAQRLGAIPVVTDYAALQETVRNGLKVDVDITDEEGQKQYKEALINLLKDEKQQEEIRGPMMKWAHDYFDWENVAKIWSKELKEWMVEKDGRKYQAEPAVAE